MHDRKNVECGKRPLLRVEYQHRLMPSAGDRTPYLPRASTSLANALESLVDLAGYVSAFLSFSRDRYSFGLS